MNTVGRFCKVRASSVARCIRAVSSLLLGAATTVHAADEIFFNGFERLAIVQINEFNANISSGCDLIELRVMSGGSMAGYLLQQRDTAQLVTFPDGFEVAANDIIVVHMNAGSSTCNPNGATSETVAKDELPAASYPQNYDTAWDMWSADTGLTNTDNVFTLYDDHNNIMDAVFASDDPTGTAASGTETQAAIVALAGQWTDPDGTVPVGGYIDDAFSASAAQDLNATGTSAAGESIQRNTDADTNTKTDWVQTASSWGAPNTGQQPQ